MKWAIILHWFALLENTPFQCPLDLTQPITGGIWPYFRLIGPDTRDIRPLIKQTPHVVGFFEHYRTVSARCVEFQTALPSAWRIRWSDHEWLESAATWTVRWAGMRSQDRPPFHLNPDRSIKVFLIALKWQQFNHSHSIISMISMRLAFCCWHFLHCASAWKYIQVIWQRSSRKKTSVKNYEKASGC